MIVNLAWFNILVYQINFGFLHIKTENSAAEIDNKMDLKQVCYLNKRMKFPHFSICILCKFQSSDVWIGQAKSKINTIPIENENIKNFQPYIMLIEIFTYATFFVEGVGDPPSTKNVLRIGL